MNYASKQVRITYYLVMTLLLTSLSGGCEQNSVKGNGREKKITRSVSAFRTATIHDHLDVILQHGSPSKVIVTTDANLHRYIDVQVENGRLQLKTLKELVSRHPINVRLVSPDVSQTNYIGSKTLLLKLNSEEPFILNHKNKGRITGTGIAEKLTLNIEGEGAVDLKEVSTKEITVTSTSSADVTVTANQSAQINHYGNGKIILYGSPKDVLENIKGSGQLIIK